MNDANQRYDNEAAVLSPVEHVFCGPGGYTITFVFSFSGVLDRDRLQRSLAETVARFPWVWSRLEQRPERSALRLALRDEPVVLEAGRAGVALHEREQFVGTVEAEVGQPLARFALTDTPSGSVLGLSLSHAIADGASFFHFLTSWARITRGEPIFEPVRVAMPLVTRTGSAELTPAQIWSECGLYSGGRRESVSSEALEEELIYMTHDDVKALHARAQRDSDMRLSTNDVITAHLWQTFVPGWCDEAGESEASVTCPVDMRLVAGIAPTHFGCALGFAVAKMDVDRLRRASLGDVAAHVRRAIKSIDRDRVLGANGTLERLRSEQGVHSVQNLHLRHPRSGMIVTNMTRMPIAELDFGAGAPVSFSADARQYHAASFYADPNGIGLRVYRKRTRASAEEAATARDGAKALDKASARAADRRGVEVA